MAEHEFEHLGEFAIHHITAAPLPEGYRMYTLTAHTPAPEPEPGWEPGDMAAVTARGWVNAWSVRTATNDGWASHDNTDDVRRDDPAGVDVDALQAAVQEAWRTRTGDDAYEAAHAALEHLGIEVPR
jgi:hypothetical protein